MDAKLQSKGWAPGKILTARYYDGDVGCTADNRRASDGHVGGTYESYNHQVSISKLGADLAWDIWNNYTSRNKGLHLVGYSMGGLVIRDAWANSGRTQGYPPRALNVAVITFGTPYGGSFGPTSLCDVQSRQCQDMKTGSAYLDRPVWNRRPRGTNGNPLVHQVTRW